MFEIDMQAKDCVCVKMSLILHLCQTVEGEEGLLLNMCDAVTLGDFSAAQKKKNHSPSVIS